MNMLKHTINEHLNLSGAKRMSERSVYLHVGIPRSSGRQQCRLESSRVLRVVKSLASNFQKTYLSTFFTRTLNKSVATVRSLQLHAFKLR
jgi:hypothetical protein